MKPAHSFSLTGLALAATLLLGACSSLPADNAALTSARAAFDSAQNNTQTRELAAAELAAAGTALNRANEAFTRRDSVAEVDHLAYLATQRVSVAQQTARQKAADAQLLGAEAERDRARLSARTSEADAAQRQAQLSQQDAQAAQRDAQTAQRDAQAAQRSAAASQMNAESAQLQTADAQVRALQLEDQLRAMNAKKTERGMVVTISDVLFDSGRAELKPGSGRDMDKLAVFFKTYPQRTAMVEGFTDSVGSEASNQDLSNRRAAAVQAALAAMGVDPARINVRGYGEAFPVAGNDNASGRQMNRRVEIVLSDDSGQVAPR